VSETSFFVSRLTRLPLLDAEGVSVGRIDDVVLGPSGPGVPPRVVGFVANVERRQIFVNANRVGEIGQEGIRLHTGTVDLRRFRPRSGEMLAKADIFDRRIGGEIVNDLAIAPTPGRFRAWCLTSASLSSVGLLRRRRAGRIAGWHEVAGVFDIDPEARQAAALRELHPADVAARIAALPLDRRRSLADAMEDERLADLLEELPEDEQVKLIESLDLDRAADVLEQMDADDAADLLAELPAAEREELLEAMEPDDARGLRRLLTYEAKTAGGLMNSEPLVVASETTVAAALARLRDPDVPAAMAAHVFVVEPPTETPTGRYIGPVGFQRLLREAPSTQVGRCIDQGPEPVAPELSEADVARRLAAYDAVAVPVVDREGRLLGAITVDDVLDHVLPEGWRRPR
jgi:CBS domain-containing protein